MNSQIRRVVRSGVLAAAYVSAALGLTLWSGLPAFAMSFASSSILLAAQPDTPAARPRALVGGHMIAALCGWAVGSQFGVEVWTAALAIGAAAAFMAATDTLHPPAAVSGFLMLQQSAHPMWLAFPILTCASVLGVMAWLAPRLVAQLVRDPDTPAP